MMTGGFTGTDNLHGDFTLATERAIVGEAIVGTTFLGGGSNVSGEITGTDTITGKLEDN